MICTMFFGLLPVQAGKATQVHVSKGPVFFKTGVLNILRQQLFTSLKYEVQGLMCSKKNNF